MPCAGSIATCASALSCACSAPPIHGPSVLHLPLPAMKRTAAIVALVLACSAGAFAPVEARAVATGAIEGPAEFKNRAYKLVNSTGNLR